MKVELDSFKKKNKRAKLYQKHLARIYLATAKLELLSIKLYTKILRKFKKDPKRYEAMERLIKEDYKHLEITNHYLKKPVKRVCFLRLGWHYFLNFLFGFTFSLRVLERVENKLRRSYGYFNDPVFLRIKAEEDIHTELLETILDNHKLEYVSMVVLSLNDAIVEMSAGIAGYSLSLGNNKVIYIIAIITGIAAALSMAASSFLSSRQSENLSPFKSLVLTGLAYLLVVFLLTSPFLIFIKANNSLIPLIIMGVVALLVIFIFNYYISVAKRQSLAKNFFTMALVALLVATISFLIGFAINKLVPIK